VRRSGSSKGKAMQRLLKYLKIKESRTAVLGDWYNDLSLFKSKGLKIALSNAIPELKKDANYVLTKSNNEDGVSDFLEALLKAKMS
jgi:hydroxymethylpyrimidine pyrophosphatase-like HAD family hydrolase